jgi:hypothetical protein
MKLVLLSIVIIIFVLLRNFGKLREQEDKIYFNEYSNSLRLVSYSKHPETGPT